MNEPWLPKEAETATRLWNLGWRPPEEPVFEGDDLCRRIILPATVARWQADRDTRQELRFTQRCSAGSRASFGRRGTSGQRA